MTRDDHKARARAIIEEFPRAAARIAEIEGRLGEVETTTRLYKRGGEYLPDRIALHEKILFEGISRWIVSADSGLAELKFFPGVLSPEAVARATPAEGTEPKFVILGGRGGSGKSWFKGQVYDPAAAICLDADEIKARLPEYEGWNAHQVHEESAEIFDLVTDLAIEMGLNIVHDSTLKTPRRAQDVVRRFRAAGYKVEAHYMHLPRQKAARRVIERFLSTRRYVPVDVILGMTTNENSFDMIRPLVDTWSFWDNDVPSGTAPILVSRGVGSVDVGLR